MMMMMDLAKSGFLIFVLCSLSLISCSQSEDVTTESPPKNGRRGRKYYDAEVYTGSDVEAVPLDAHNFQPIPRSVAGKKYVAFRPAGTGIMKKSGNNMNWNNWKGDEDHSNDDDNSDHHDGGSRWQPAPQGWGNEAWVADPMYVMMLKNAMSEFKGESKPSGLLATLSSEPALFLIAASIPISLLLAAVLPALMSYFMSSSASTMSTISTTATGASTSTRARNNHEDILPYLSPVVEAIGTFGVRSINNPECMQRIFCQVAQDKMAARDSKFFKKAASVAKFLSNTNLIGDFGVKDLIESLSSGSCENIPCWHSSEKETVKSRYSQKEQTNSVKK